MRHSLFALAAVLFVSSTASAEPAAHAPTPPLPIDEGHRHDGFYFRFASGFSAYNEVVVHRSDTGSDAPRTYVTGMGTASELAIGGTVSSGFVLGGGIWSASMLATNVSTKNGGVPAASIDGTPSLGMVGPFFDWYLNPETGFHLQAALGFALSRSIGVIEGKFETNHTAGGMGAMFGFGDEWWVGKHWSAGVMGRVLAAATVGKLDGAWYTHFASATPGVLFTLTYQ